MKFLRITLRQPPSVRHPMQEFLDGTDEVWAERLLGWTVPEDDDVWYLLLHVEGDADRYRAALDAADAVRSFDLTPVEGASFYAYVVEAVRPAEAALIDAFADRSLVVVPPVDFSPDGNPTYTVVGPAGEQTALVESIPEGVVADVERVGEYDHRYPGLAGRVSDRQREAVAAAVAAGYYAVPRECDLAEVAARLDCSTAAASKLLRRAEAAVMEAVLQG